jgi:hypothetical protein
MDADERAVQGTFLVGRAAVTSKMIQRKFNVSVRDTASRYIAAAEAELAADPTDTQLRDLVTTMREVIGPRERIPQYAHVTECADRTRSSSA